MALNMQKLQLKPPNLSAINQANLWLTIKVATVTFATFTLFNKDLTIIFLDALNSEATSHILIVPFILAYLLFRKRKTLLAVMPLDNTDQPKPLRHLPPIVGALLIITSIFLYWYGSYTFTPLEHHMLALPIFVAGSTLLLFNTQTLRQLAFPIAFLFFLVPPPSEILFTIGGMLSALSSQVSSSIVNLAGIPSTLISEYSNPIILITRPDGTTINFTIDIACSGIYSLIGFIIFATLIAYLIRDKTWKKIALILTGIPIIYLFSIIRITTILLIGYQYGETLALQVFHLLGGWVTIFLGTLTLLVTSEKLLKTQIFAAKTPDCIYCNPKPQPNQNFCQKCGQILKPKKAKIKKTDITKIAAITITVIALLSIQAPVFALTESPAVVIVSTPAGEQASTDILPNIPGYTLQFSYRDTDFEEKAKTDMALAYIYVPHDKTKELIWVAIEIASARSALHRWETCLVTYPLSQGWKTRVTEIELHDVQLSENPLLVSRYFAFQYTQTNMLQAVLYWYDSATFNVNQTLQQKHVKISLIAYPNNTEELPQIENQLTTLATPIAEYWQPIKIWSPIALTLSQNGAQLATTTTIILIAALLLYGYETRKQKRLSKNAYNKLSEPNKQLINIIQQTQKAVTPTLENIINTYQKTTGQTIDHKQLHQSLTELEKTGVIQSQITNKQDKPIQTWKTKL
jgi:exosortase